MVPLTVRVGLSCTFNLVQKLPRDTPGTAQRFVSVVTLHPVRLTDKINIKEKKKAEESGTFGKLRQVECQCQKDLVPHCWPSIERRTLDQWLKVTNKRLSVVSMGPLLYCRRKGILASPDTRIFTQRGQARPGFCTTALHHDQSVWFHAVTVYIQAAAVDNEIKAQNKTFQNGLKT